MPIDDLMRYGEDFQRETVGGERCSEKLKPTNRVANKCFERTLLSERSSVGERETQECETMRCSTIEFCVRSARVKCVQHNETLMKRICLQRVRKMRSLQVDCEFHGWSKSQLI